jgi:hypothetical protein
MWTLESVLHLRAITPPRSSFAPHLHLVARMVPLAWTDVITIWNVAFFYCHPGDESARSYCVHCMQRPVTNWCVCAGMTSFPEAVSHTTSELTVPQDPHRRVSIASDPPTIVDGRLSPYFGHEPRRRLSAASSELQASDGRRKSILVQHTPETMSLHSHHSGNPHYVNYGFQYDGKH